MKYFAAISVLVLSMTTMARSIQYSEEFTLSRVSKNGVKQQSYVGKATVNYHRQTLQLEIYNDPCGQFTPPTNSREMRCMAAAMLVQKLVVPLESREESCGSVIFTGHIDMRQVQGDKQEIVILDHRQRKCRDRVMAPVVVEAVHQGPRDLNETSYLLLK